MVLEVEGADWRKILGVGQDGRPNAVPRSNYQQGGGGHFPGSEADRKRGQYRESEYPRLTQQAVCDDDGNPLLESTNALLAVLILELRALREALSP